MNRVVKRDGLFSGTATVANGVAGVAIPERRYANMRPSGVAWLGDVPEHWRTKPLRFACRLNPTKGEISHLPPDTEVSFVPMEAVREFGGMDLAQTKPIESVLQGYTYFRDGDVVVAKITPCFENGKGSIAAGLTNGLGFGTTELHTLRPRPELDRQFLFYLTLSHEFRQQGAGQMYGAGGQKRVPESFLRDFVAPLPPLPEQQAIARWLDERTRRIDELVVAKRRLINLLAEQRTALITHAVTKGLNPHAPIRPSGITWLRDVPGEVRRLKFLSSFVTSGSRGWAEYYSNEGEVFLRIGNVSRVGVDLDLSDIQRVTPPEGAEGERTVVRGGDVLISVTAYIGAIGLIPDGFEKGYVNQHLALVRPRRDRVEPRYLAYALFSGLGQIQFRQLMNGGTKEGLGLEDVKNLFVIVPPLPEQRAVVAHLDSACAKLDALTATTETAIARLTEYRQAIISAAVTGQIDLRISTSTEALT